MTFLPVSTRSPLALVTVTVVSPVNRPCPSTTSILFFFISDFTPLFNWAATLRERSVTFFKSNDGFSTLSP